MKTLLKECRWGKFLLLRGDMISRLMDIYGEWAEAELDLFRSLLPRDGVAIEVGSNIGAHAVALSRMCEAGRVFCFEPQRPIFQLLCANLALNDRINVVARNAAAGERCERIVIETSDYSEAWNYGSFSLSAGFSREGKFQGRISKETIDCVALDEDPAIAELGRVDLIKVDVEGHEPAVLRGARSLIRRHQPDVFAEATVADVVEATIAEMRAHDYVGYWFVASRFRPDNFNGVGLRVEGWDPNILFRPASRPAPSGLRKVAGFADLAAGAGVPILLRYP